MKNSKQVFLKGTKFEICIKSLWSGAVAIKWLFTRRSIIFEKYLKFSESEYLKQKLFKKLYNSLYSIAAELYQNVMGNKLLFSVQLNWNSDAFMLIQKVNKNMDKIIFLKILIIYSKNPFKSVWYLYFSVYFQEEQVEIKSLILKNRYNVYKIKVENF